MPEKKLDRSDAAQEADERRFNETLRNLLNTPPKPHNEKSASKPAPKRESDAKD
jgi:hypothetical protein